MAASSSVKYCFLIAIFLSTLSISNIHFTEAEIANFSNPHDLEKVYIVYMGSLPKNSSSSQHMEMLQEIKGSKASASLVYSYHRSFNGFAAKLTIAEMEHLSGKEGVVSVFESKAHMIQTTSSWDFMGFNLSVQRSQAESDVVVGVFDSGIWPESESFRDDNFGPPPAKWAGICQGGDNFTCNNKVIGARFYDKFVITNQTLEFISPRDSNGHGTHTASIVAGGLVEDASLFGIGAGIVRGGVPSARLAIYKVCWFGISVCSSADILAAFDDAIADGVDIISISAGLSPLRDYFHDPVAIGSFHAYRKGILTSAAAGNLGPEFGTLSNTAPWALSVAAATIDRKFFTAVKFGDGENLEGYSANTFEDDGSMSELVQLSCPASLGTSDVQDKIILCRYDPSAFINNRSVDLFGISQIIHQKGAAGAVLPRLDRRESQKSAVAFPLPTATLTTEDASQAFAYINSTSHPTAAISKTSEGKDPTAPLVADTSSRGPNPADLNILKPDIAAPGVNILAAWSAAAPLTPVGDDRRTAFNIDTGTSMACPHVSAVAAYVKSFQPSWSPSMIISSLLTTAWPMSPEANNGAEFAYGAGFINPLAAVDPGLVYDNNADDFIGFLCTRGYSTGLLQLVTGDTTTCNNSSIKTIWDCFSVYTPDGSVSATFSRVATCVGAPGNYEARIEAADGFYIRVEPQSLSCNSSGDQPSFQMFINGTLADSNISSSSLVWTDGVHFVRSPIVIHSILKTANSKMSTEALSILLEDEIKISNFMVH